MKKSVRTSLIIILAVICLAACTLLGQRLLQGRAAAEEYRQAEEVGKPTGTTEDPGRTSAPEVTEQIPTVPPASETEPSATPAPQSTAAPTPGPSEGPAPQSSATPAPAPTPAPGKPSGGESLPTVDLAALRRVNPDVVGWIMIPGTELSYPLVQGKDNDYYLDRTWQKTKSAAGSIYLDYRNSSDMSDFNSIIYGHRMSDGTMFNCLRHYRDAEYWLEHPAIYIVTDAGTLCYEIFSAYEADAVNGHTYRLGLVEADGQQAYINYCSRRSVVDIDVEPEPGDRIITLSTCVSLGANYDTRWVVQAVCKTEP